MQCIGQYLLRNKALKTKENSKRTQEERRDHTRAALLESTIDEIANSGLLNCKLSEIVRDAGVTTGAVQHLFGSRDALILDAIEEIFQRMDYPLEKEGDLVDRMKALGRYRAGAFGKNTNKALVDIVLNSKHDSKLGKLIRKRLAKQSRHYEEWWLWYFSDFGIPAKVLTLVERSLAASLYGLNILSINRLNETEYQEVLDYTIDACINMLEQYTNDNPPDDILLKGSP